jgi:hypothetical protein
MVTSTAERTRLYRRRHPERVRASKRANYLANWEKARDYRRAYHQANRGVYAERNRTTAHGITRTIRDWMYESQDRACAGCHTPMPDEKLEVDHDHACCPGKRSCGRCVRGLLCHPCNKRDVLAAPGSTRKELRQKEIESHLRWFWDRVPPGDYQEAHDRLSAIRQTLGMDQ